MRGNWLFHWLFGIKKTNLEEKEHLESLKVRQLTKDLLFMEESLVRYRDENKILQKANAVNMKDMLYSKGLDIATAMFAPKKKDHKEVKGKEIEAEVVSDTPKPTKKLTDEELSEKILKIPKAHLMMARELPKEEIINYAKTKLEMDTETAERAYKILLKVT